jgi:sec-independent protein translocase protein TatC
VRRALRASGRHARRRDGASTARPRPAPLRPGAARLRRVAPPEHAGVKNDVDPKRDELEGTEQPFVSHLVELRDRLIRASLAIGVCFGLLSFWPGPAGLYDLLAAPLVAHMPRGGTLIATSVISPFLVPLKITLMAAFLLALPVVLYQAWAFVAPGLYLHEKKLVLPLVVSSTLLFFLGIGFCYFFVFGQVFKFIQSFAPTTVAAMPDIEAYLSFVLTMFIAFGAAFEVPVVVVVLARLNFVSIEKLKAFRSYFIVLAFIIAAVLTPPDVVSQLALAVPMVLLYEVGIWAARLFIRHTQAPADDETAT